MNPRVTTIHKLLVVHLVLILISAGLGCQRQTEKMRQKLGMNEDTRLDTALRLSLAQTGGVDQWALLDNINGVAITTLFESDGGNTLVEQQHHLAAGDRLRLAVISNDPTGVWTETLTPEGTVQMVRQGGDEPLYETDSAVLYGAGVKLRLLAYALMGPAALLQKDLSVSYAGKERQSGRLMHRIEVSGRMFQHSQFLVPDSPDLLVMWIDTETRLWSQLWLQYPLGQGRFGYLAVNASGFEPLPQGLTLPMKIEFLHSDKYQQFGHTSLMTVEYQDLQVEMKSDQADLWSWRAFD